MSGDLAAASAELFGGSAPTPETLRTMWRGGPKEYELRIESVGASAQQLYVTLRLQHENVDIPSMKGITRSFFRDREGKLCAYHDYFVLPLVHQQHGIAGGMMRNSVNAYLQMGVDRVEVSAAWMGKYTWATFGFNWDDDTARDVRWALEQFLIRHGVSPKLAFREAVRTATRSWKVAALDLDGIRVLAEVGKDDMGEPVMEHVPLGKAFLLERRMWHGVLPLHDDKAEEWLHLAKKFRL